MTAWRRSPPASHRSKSWRACSRSDSVSDTGVESRQLHAELSIVRHRRSVRLRKTFGTTATEARCLTLRVHPGGLRSPNVAAEGDEGLDGVRHEARRLAR